VSELIAVRGGEVTGTAARDGATITAFLKGNADMTAIDAVGKLIADLHVEATRAKTTEVIVDLRDLEFMNSSCFKAIVTWIASIRALDAAKRYRVRFVANPAMHWQKRSLDALRCFAVDLIAVDGLTSA
jgi:hypothetical protein